VIFGAKAAGYPQVPDDTVFRETAYLGSAIVDSTHETGVEGEGKGRPGTTRSTGRD
jgi:hypothetical protein